MHIVFEMGGTKTRMAGVLQGKLTKCIVVPTPKKYQAGIKQLYAYAQHLADVHRIEKVVCGIAGTPNGQRNGLARSPHLSGWVKKPLVRDLSKQFRATVRLENDAVLAGLGEAHYGAGKGRHSMGYIAVGTGIGGALVIDGQTWPALGSFEPGHHIIDWNAKKSRHPSPHIGSWESFVSGSAMKLRYGKASEQIHDKQIWQATIQEFAKGLVNVAAFWSPEVIVLGGSLMRSMPLAKVRAAFRSQLKMFPQAPSLLRGKLGEEAGLYGGLALLKQRS